MPQLSVEAPAGALPLTEFRGRLVPPQEVSPNPGYDSDDFGITKTRQDKTTYVVGEFHFDDVEVIESSEPYIFPICTVVVGYKLPSESKGGTAWEALASSVRKLGAGVTIKGLAGKYQRWKMIPATVRAQLTDDDGTPKEDANGNQVWGNVLRPCWQVAEVEGLGNVAEMAADLDAHMVEIADGKNEDEFYTAALKDSQVRKRGDVVEAITSRTWLQPMLDAGRLTRTPDGKLHKPEAGGE